MEAISKSRLLNNLKRDLRQNYKTDESLSILNLSGREIEITDETTGITKIVYPRSIFHTNRPQTNIVVTQSIGNESDDSIKPLERIIAKIHRSKIRNNFICIDTPVKYVNEVGNYGEILSIKWINKLLAKSDIFVITGFDNNYLIKNDAVPDNTSATLIILVIIAVIAVAIMIALASIPEINFR